MKCIAEDDLRAHLFGWRITPLTVPLVPTGMKDGVCTTPWFSVSVPRRAWLPGRWREFEVQHGSVLSGEQHCVAVAEEAVALADCMAYSAITWS